MLATDTDLVIVEPALFTDVAWVAQRLVSTIGVVADSVVTLTAPDVDFERARVRPGHVVLIDGVACAVAERLAPLQARLTRPRAEPADPEIPVGDDPSARVEVFTFTPQIASVHRRLLRMLGIEPDAGGSGVGPGEADITNPRDLRRLTVLGALADIYAAASAPGSRRDALADKADAYRRAFARERETSCARIDLDGDGRPDALRRFNAVQFTRA